MAGDLHREPEAPTESPRGSRFGQAPSNRWFAFLCEVSLHLAEAVMGKVPGNGLARAWKPTSAERRKSSSVAPRSTSWPASRGRNAGAGKPATGSRSVLSTSTPKRRPATAHQPKLHETIGGDNYLDTYRF